MVAIMPWSWADELVRFALPQSPDPLLPSTDAVGWDREDKTQLSPAWAALPASDREEIAATARTFNIVMAFMGYLLGKPGFAECVAGEVHHQGSM
jgi:hypothetical protein